MALTLRATKGSRLTHAEVDANFSGLANGSVVALPTANTMLYAGAAGALTQTVAPTNGQLLIGSTGAAPALGTLTGTANQVTVTNGAGSVTLSLPQNIHTAATPTFAGLTLTGALAGTSATFSGNVTLGDAVVDSHTVNGSLTQVVTVATAAFRTHSATGDDFRIVPFAAGLGAQINVTNSAVTDYEPLELVGESVATFARTGVLTAAEITRVTSAGFDITQATTAILRFGGANTLQRVAATGAVTLASNGAPLVIDPGGAAIVIGGATQADSSLAMLGTWAGSVSYARGLLINQTYTPAANLDSYGLQVATTHNKAASGTHSDFVGAMFNGPVIGAGAAALTNASTVKISGAPTGATNNYALWVDAGKTRFDSDLIFQGGGSVQVGTFDNFDLRFMTNNTDRMVLYTTGNVKIASSALRATTEGTNHLDIFDGTAPVGTLSNGISLYSTAGELRVMDAAGNATLLSPHDSDGNWIHDEVNFRGRRLRIDMEKFVKAVNERLGLDFVQEYIHEHRDCLPQ